MTYYDLSSPWGMGQSMPIFPTSRASSFFAARTRQRNYASFPSYSIGFASTQRHQPALQTPFRSPMRRTSMTTMPCSSKTAAQPSSSSSLNAILDFPNAHHLGDVVPSTLLSLAQNTMFSHAIQPVLPTNVQFQRGLEKWMFQSSPFDNKENLEVTVETPMTLNSNILLSEAVFQAGGKAERTPTKEEIELLQKAFATFYSSNPSVRNVPQAVELLGKCVNIWEETKQSGDEIAGLLRVRGDAYMVSYIFDFASLGVVLLSLWSVFHKNNAGIASAIGC